MATQRGTPFDDRLFGGTDDDDLFGEAGNDRLYGGNGADRLFGGDDNDILLGEIGNDRLYGGAGQDRLYGGDGNDIALGEAGNDKLYGGNGQDRLYGGDDNDDLLGEIGNDSLYGGSGQDRLYGGDGNDDLLGEAGNDRLYGGSGRDRLYGGDDNDDLLGEVGNDRLYGGDGQDRLYGGDGNDDLLGEVGNDTLYGGAGKDRLYGGDGNDELLGEVGNDLLFGGDGSDVMVGGVGNDTLRGEAGNDTVIVDVSTAGTDQVDLGDGNDVVNVSGAPEVRLTFTSAEAGNGSANDSNTLANQDGGLAVRAQAEDGSGSLTGPVSRYDDEGISFVAVRGTTFDVRDLPTGTQRGNQFNVVTLGTSGADVIAATAGSSLNYYINAGAGADTVTGANGDDFLVGGGGDDSLDGGGGNDTFIGGGGADTIAGGLGNDTVIADVSTAGADQVDLGDGDDVVNVSGAPEVRLTFTSAEVGNGSANDSNTMANQDGGLAVRVQAEDGSDGLTGPVARYDDEGISFVAAAGTSFDVRDLVSGAQRGNQFNIVTLGTSGADVIAATAGSTLNYYINAGAGADTVTGANGDDFLVGGGGDDSLDGGDGDDSFIGGGGADTITGGLGNDTVIADVSTAGADQVDLGDGDDAVNVSGAPEVRLTFTSADVGNGAALDGNNAANEDGGLAVRAQAEDGSGNLTGPVARYDDEGISFVAAAGTTFDVRDLPTGTQRGNQFNVVTLGTSGADVIAGGIAGSTLNYYINGGGGNDTITGENGNDFLVGGGGDDGLDGGGGDDSFIGGGGADTITGGLGNDTVIVDVSTAGADQVDLGDGDDIVTVSGASQVRLTFTSAEVGNGSASESGAVAGQDGGLAVRLQAEDGSDGLAGPVSRYDDEGIGFVALAAGTTFDVRDISGVQRGDQFQAVGLGTAGDDVFVDSTLPANVYANFGAGNDTGTTGSGNDFLVGGAGDDALTGGTGVDSLLGGAGDDSFFFATDDTGRQATATADTILTFAAGDTIFLQGEYDFAGSAAPEAGEYSITGDGGNFLLTYNSAGTLHDIIVTGSDPTGSVSFY